MKIYEVGGAVRDRLLGHVPKDVDYVVVGACPQEMLDAGYLQVGADFPVFLHPQTHDEYALARLERKVGVGYNGFSVDIKGVTLEEDLSRRDLTINAMARSEDGSIVDPYGGQADLANKTLRHVSHAFEEDPLRVLRLARFLARFGVDWSIAADTWQLLERMVLRGDLDALTRERVWVEFEKGFREPYPQLMVATLRELGVFDRPSFAEYALLSTADLDLLARTAELAVSVPARVALAMPRSWSAEQAKESRIPADVRDACQGVERALAAEAVSFPSWDAQRKLDLLERLDVLRRAECFDTVCEAVGVLAPQAASALKLARELVRRVDQRKAIEGLKEAQAIRAAIRAARLAVLG